MTTRTKHLKLERQFWRAIAEGDPVARMAYADWLSEHGLEAESKRQRELAGGLVKLITVEQAREEGRDCKIRFGLVGQKGCVSFVVGTRWYLPQVHQQMLITVLSANTQADQESLHRVLLEAQGVDLSYHSRTPLYENQEPSEETCEYLHCPCYWDSSALGARPVYLALVERGSDAVWEVLRDRYERQWGEI